MSSLGPLKDIKPIRVLLHKNQPPHTHLISLLTRKGLERENVCILERETGYNYTKFHELVKEALRSNPCEEALKETAWINLKRNQTSTLQEIEAIAATNIAAKDPKNRR